MDRGDSAGDCDEGISLFLHVRGVTGGGISAAAVRVSDTSSLFDCVASVPSCFTSSTLGPVANAFRAELLVFGVRVGISLGFSGEIRLRFLPTGEAT